MSETARQILHEVVSDAAIARANEPGRHQLGICADRRPRPHVTNAELATHFFRDVLLLRINEAPNLIALETLARQVAQSLVLVRGAGRSDIDEQLGHGIDGAVSEAAGGAEAGTFDEKAEDLGALCCCQLVHVQRLNMNIMLDRSCICQFENFLPFNKIDWREGFSEDLGALDKL